MTEMMSTSQWMPHIYIPKTTPPYIVIGSMVDIIHIIFAKLGHCTTWVLAKGLIYGTQLPNKTWSGLIGQLMRHEVDVTGTPVSMTDSRARAIDFSIPLYMDTQAVAHKKPVYESDLAGFVKPYKNEIWVLLLVTMIMVFFVLLAIAHIAFGSSLKSSENRKEKAWFATDLTIMPLLGQKYLDSRHINITLI
ncbi:glutamate [NMDA] receptor subunit 1-like [Macrobrachium nipponense]|uniref:glutamate [NMDA] receptor subunit 1-like n=1 Tax=Macrobrachium nipponense TaxID=159736 RepID=UPI0030C7D054